MKKFIALSAVLICAFLLFGCSQSVDVKFVDMGAVLSGGEYERCVYSVEISDGAANAAASVINKYTDDDNSEMSLTFRKQTDGTALIEMELKVTFVSTPPYVPAENAAKEKIDYTGLTDTITSKVWFNGYSQDFNPIRIEKTVNLETSKKWDKDKDGNSTDKSFSAEFTYPVGKERGTGKYTDSAGKETEFNIKAKSLKNAFDNEQIYYMASAFLRGTLDTNGQTALGYTKQYKVFNLADRCIYGKGAASLSFIVGATPLGDYGDGDKKILVGTAGSIDVEVKFQQGKSLFLYYSLGDSISIGGKSFRPRKNLLLGYKQESAFGVNSFSTVTAYALKDYSTVEA